MNYKDLDSKKSTKLTPLKPATCRDMITGKSVDLYQIMHPIKRQVSTQYESSYLQGLADKFATDETTGLFAVCQDNEDKWWVISATDDSPDIPRGSRQPFTRWHQTTLIDHVVQNGFDRMDKTPCAPSWPINVDV